MLQKPHLKCSKIFKKICPECSARLDTVQSQVTVLGDMKYQQQMRLLGVCRGKRRMSTEQYEGNKEGKL